MVWGRRKSGPKLIKKKINLPLVLLPPRSSLSTVTFSHQHSHHRLVHHHLHHKQLADHLIWEVATTKFSLSSANFFLLLQKPTAVVNSSINSATNLTSTSHHGQPDHRQHSLAQVTFPSSPLSSSFPRPHRLACRMRICFACRVQNN